MVFHWSLCGSKTPQFYRSLLLLLLLLLLLIIIIIIIIIIISNLSEFLTLP